MSRTTEKIISDFNDRPRNVRVIYSYFKQQHLIDDGYDEIIKQAGDIDEDFLRNHYKDASMTTYKFIRQIERKNHNFKRSDVLYFYIYK